MTTGEVIRKYRKEKQMTQEYMAHCLGVTTAAVNKWENGNSCPDIALLGPIARLLGISTDTLLSYRDELTEQELQQYLEQIEARLMIEKEPYNEVFRWAMQVIYEYPDCEELIFQFAQLLDYYRLYEEVADADSYDSQIRELYERMIQSSNPDMKMAAANVLFRESLRKEDLNQAEKYLDMIPDQKTDKAQLRASLFHKQGQTEAAYRECEQILFEGLQKLSAALTEMYIMAMEVDDLDTAEYYETKRGELSRVLEMGEYLTGLVGLELTIHRKDKEICLAKLLHVTENIGTFADFRFSRLYAHMDFNEEMDPSGAKLTLLKMLEDESLDFIKDDERYEVIMTRLR